MKRKDYHPIQDELNQLNKPFFDACNGIFLNYTWKAEDRPGGINSLQNSVAALGNESRRGDIFVGLDVFGRGCVGGGGLNSRLALSIIRNHDLSVAIFAQGWTYESCDRQGRFCRYCFFLL